MSNEYSVADQMAYDLRMMQEKSDKKWKKRGVGLGFVGLGIYKNKKKRR